MISLWRAARSGDDDRPRRDRHHLTQTPDATSNQSRQITGVVYEVTVHPATLVLKADGQDCQLQSGMEGSVEIVTREETVLQFLLRRTRLLRH